MNFKLRHEIKMGRFPRPERCVFRDQTCYGAVLYAHWNYERWDNCMPLCRSHSARFDHWRPKTLNVQPKKRQAA